MNLWLSERTCVVTGASRGVGREVARLLRAEGATVLMVARDENALREAAAALSEAGEHTATGGLHTLALDITDPGAPALVLEFADGELGGADVLVNNAGTSSARPLAQLTDEDWRLQWELNVMAPMRLMRALAPGMAERGWGRIVNVSSSAGKRPSLTNVAYSVTKAAELSLSRAFADAYAPRGVLVNAVAPGAVATDLWMAPGGLADQAAESNEVSREQAIEAQRARIPLARFADAEEVASVIVFLCSERASDVTGAAWSVDGGTVPVIL